MDVRYLLAEIVGLENSTNLEEEVFRGDLVVECDLAGVGKVLEELEAQESHFLVALHQLRVDQLYHFLRPARRGERRSAGGRGIRFQDGCWLTCQLSSARARRLPSSSCCPER